MTIRNKRAYADAAWDWGPLDACFSDRIRVSDVDGVVERNGQFLFIEAKPPREYLAKKANVWGLKRGQNQTHRELTKIGATVMCLWGTPPFNPQEWALRLPGSGDNKPIKGEATTVEKVVAFTSRWFAQASSEAHPGFIRLMSAWNNATDYEKELFLKTIKDV